MGYIKKKKKSAISGRDLLHFSIYLLITLQVASDWGYFTSHMYFDVNNTSLQLKGVPVFTTAEYMLDNFPHKSCMKYRPCLQFDGSGS